MPERAAIVTALIMDRPLCLACVAQRASLDECEAQTILDKIESVLELQRVQPGRCRACGSVVTVFSVAQPPA
jgi:hypothetical protein